MLNEHHRHHRPLHPIPGPSRRAMLRVNGVALLCDIRSYPSSKRCPQWNQAEIIAAMPSDISYARVRARTRRAVQLAEKLTVAIACTEAVFLALPPLDDHRPARRSWREDGAHHVADVDLSGVDPRIRNRERGWAHLPSGALGASVSASWTSISLRPSRPSQPAGS